MRKAFLLLLTIFFINVYLPAYAGNAISLMTNRGYEIGLQFSNYKYEEEVDGAYFMSTEGDKVGFIFNATDTIGDNSFVV